MRNIQLDRTINAPQSSVWAVLADFPNIADWNEGVKTSFATSDATQGVGAQRHCDLAPVGGLEETVTEWVPEERMVISIDEASRIPIKEGLVTFTLAEGDGATTAAMSYDYEPKGGVLGRVIGPVLDWQLRRGFTGFLEQLDEASRTR